MMREPTERFWSKVDPCRTDGCALWLTGLDSQGYPRFYLNGKSTLAYHFLVGKAPEGLQWDHVKARGCTHRNCVWPGHLELVTPRENTLRGGGPTALAAKATHCPWGHPYNETNTYFRPQGGRACRTCKSLSQKAGRDARRERLRGATAAAL